MPLWVKVSVVVALLSTTVGGLIYYVDSLCNSEKRSLKKDIKLLQEKIRTKSDSIVRLELSLQKNKDTKQNEVLRAKIECAKAQRRYYETPIVDTNSSFWF